MPTLRRSAKKAVADLDAHVDESARALEKVATNLETVETNPEDGKIAAIGVVNDATVNDASNATSAPRQHRAKLPEALQFPLVAVISFSLSSLLYSLLNVQTSGELANVARTADTWGELAVLAGWKLFELALGWFGSFDSLDLAALNLLAHGPAIYLLATFYNISATTALGAVTIEVLSTFVPFQLLRPLSGFHARKPTGIANSEIVTDVPIAILTTILSSFIFGITIFTALHTYLPTSFVLYFEGIPSLEPAYKANYLTILPVTLAFGFAARSFMFTPFAATGVSKEDGKLEEFDPVTATLGETVFFNLWGYTTRAKVIIYRTAVAVFVTGFNAYLQTFMTIGGVESQGAVAYASAWAVATFLTGSALAFVGGDA